MTMTRSVTAERPRTLGELKARGYTTRSVRDELRANLLEKLRRRENAFPGIVGFDSTVIPQVVQAILSRHDLVLLGLRGQAKSRMARQLTALLDERIPAVADCPIHCDPYRPACKPCRDTVRTQGDATPIAWLGREERYGEKLATPDVTMADIIGDIDPIKAATERRFYSDEAIIHYGILPRRNRGIFVINELPDLQPRIQVGLFDIMEERDFQIRGFPVRIPLDIVMVFTANPEDYTNRGSIVTPLKDRIASQIMTHYPRSLEEGLAITAQESWADRDGSPVRVPRFMAEIIEEIAFAGRRSEYVDQSSGVSARLPIACLENLVSAVERRNALTGERGRCPRITDLEGTIPAITGKVELVLEGEQEGVVKVARHLIGQAVRVVFDRRMPPVERRGRDEPSEMGPYKPIIDWFARGRRVELADDMPFKDYRKALVQVPELEKLAKRRGDDQGEEEVAVTMELILEGLHQHSLVGKEDADTGRVYMDMLGVMFEES